MSARVPNGARRQAVRPSRSGSSMRTLPCAPGCSPWPRESSDRRVHRDPQHRRCQRSCLLAVTDYDEQIGVVAIPPGWVTHSDASRLSTSCQRLHVDAPRRSWEFARQARSRDDAQDYSWSISICCPASRSTPPADRRGGMVEGILASWSNARSTDDAEMSGVCAPTITSTLSPASFLTSV